MSGLGDPVVLAKRCIRFAHFVTLGEALARGRIKAFAMHIHEMMRHFIEWMGVGGMIVRIFNR